MGGILSACGGDRRWIDEVMGRTMKFLWSGRRKTKRLFGLAFSVGVGDWIPFGLGGDTARARGLGVMIMGRRECSCEKVRFDVCTYQECIIHITSFLP